MSSNLKVNTILPSTGSNVAIGTAGGTVTMVGNVDIDINSGISTFNDIHVSDKIVHDGDTNTSLRFPAADTITAETSGSERLRIDANGVIQAKTRSAEVRRMILSGSPTNSAFNIEAHDGETGTSSGDVQGKLGLFYNDGSTLNNTANISFMRGSSSADGAMSFITNQTERLRIDSSGILLLGTTTEGFATADNFTISDTTTDCGMTIRAGTSSQSIIAFSDATSGDPVKTI